MARAVLRLGTGCLLLVGAGAVAEGLIKGVCYGPAPVLTPAEASRLPEDDWFCDAASPMWSSKGRGDLRIIRSLGANLVRLYGNNPANQHKAFLDEAHKQGLQVAPGMSDWPYYQMTPGGCRDTNFNCFSQIKDMYNLSLQNGFLTESKRYHPALRVMNILNEADLKMPPDADTGGADGPVKMARALISAFDALLDAEKEAGVKGRLLNVTATFSYAICSACANFSGRPALGQIAQLHDAMHHPERYGYTPRHNITEAYRLRWMHSFNTANPASDLQGQFLDAYTDSFPSTPVYIGEYHRVGSNVTDDVGAILDIARSSSLFLGISFFEYTVSYYKTGSEMEFGLFGVRNHTLTDMQYFTDTYPIYCLEAQPDTASGTAMAEALARVYGGALNKSLLCDESLATRTAVLTAAPPQAPTTTPACVTTTRVKFLPPHGPAADYSGTTTGAPTSAGAATSGATSPSAAMRSRWLAALPLALLLASRRA